jgi:hypothetical protein
MNATETATAAETATVTATIISNPQKIADRLESWLLTEEPRWAILTTSSGVCVEFYGILKRKTSGSGYYLRTSDPHSHVDFPLSSVDAVGATCIFLKY